MPIFKEDGFAAASSASHRQTALEKGLDVLEVAAQVDAPISLIRLAEKLSRPMKDISRITEILIERGYLLSDGNTYSISPKMLNLARSSHPIRALIDKAQPHMGHLVGQIGHACHLSVTASHELVTISACDAVEDFSFNLKPGFRCRLASCAAGAVIFGLETLDTRARLSSHLKRDLGDEAWHDFYATAENARVAGHCMSPSDIMPAITDISAPVFDDKGVRGALTVPFFRPRNGVTIDDVRRLLEDVCHRLSLELGRPNKSPPRFSARLAHGNGRPPLTLVHTKV